jgi:ActR/RegA family two-component response regulator
MTLVTQTKGKVLIVEDQDSWRKLYEKTLSRNNYWAISCSTLNDALDTIDRNYFHAGVVDIRLVDADPNNTDGMKVVERIAQSGEDTGVIVLTGFGTVGMTRQAFKKYDVSDFLEKNGGFEPDKFIQAIEEAVTKSRTHIDGRKRTQLTALNWIKGPSPRDVESALASGGFEAINSVLERLLYDVYPLRLSKQLAKIEQADGHSLLTTHYWSRYLGAAITLHMGHVTVIAKEVEQLKTQAKAYAYADAGQLAGIVYQNDSLGLEEFE